MPFFPFCLCNLYVLAYTTWSGPTIKPVFNSHRIPALEIEGQISAVSFMVGNTQGGLDDNYAAWSLELKKSAEAGERVFGVCFDGSDLVGVNVSLSAHNRDSI